MTVKIQDSSLSTPRYPPKESRRMTKNVIVLGSGFLLLFTAYNGMANLMSSFYPSGGLGTYTNAVVYFSFIISALFLPSFLIKQLSIKRCIVLPMFGYTTYMAAQYYPGYYTLIPAAVIVGLCAAPLWTSKAFYLTHLGNEYAQLNEKDREASITHFFGLFFLLFQSGHVWGNLLSSTIFSSGNVTFPSEQQMTKCGVIFCPGDLESAVSEKEKDDSEKTKIYIFSAVCICCALLAITLLSLLLDPLTRYGENSAKKGEKEESGCQLIMATFTHMKNPYQILLIPLTIFAGLQGGFIGTDFTQAFITCSLGVHKVGYILMCFGVVDAILSISFGRIVRSFGRVPVFTIGVITGSAVLLLMLTAKEWTDKEWVLYLIAGLWGASDAIFHTQLSTLYGVLFKGKEGAAFSNQRLWESLGFIIAYINGGLFCIRTKLWVLLVLLAVGMVGFYCIEVMERRMKRNLESKGSKGSVEL